MAGHSHVSLANEKMQFEFTSKLKTQLMTVMALGVAFVAIWIIWSIVVPVAETHGHGGHALASGGGEEVGHGYSWTKRLWANLWLCAYYFNGIALVGVFFVAVNYVAWAGWSAMIKRVPEAFGYFLMVTGPVLLVVFLLGGHDIFHWTHAELYDTKSAHYDPIIAGKAGFLNTSMFIGLMAIFFGLWIGLFLYIRKMSLEEDKITDYKGYLKQPDLYNKIVYWSAGFIIVFAVSNSVSAWHWVMSIDAHWFSTMFGWYNFASYFVAGMATVTLAVVLLKEQGYFVNVSIHHLHDLGKFMFAFSVFWTYIWFSQFMLIYYAHLPEETIYFYPRLFGEYRPIFFLNLLINFFFPFLALMAKESKRTMLILKIVACAILIGHYIDFYMMIMPGTVGKHYDFGLVEFGCIMIFASAFIYMFAYQLSKASLIAKNHPFIKESMNFSQFN
jgi:hypothetical protein